jgi:hypothetical protein
MHFLGGAETERAYFVHLLVLFIVGGLLGMIDAGLGHLVGRYIMCTVSTQTARAIRWEIERVVEKGRNGESQRVRKKIQGPSLKFSPDGRSICIATS